MLLRSPGVVWRTDCCHSVGNYLVICLPETVETDRDLTTLEKRGLVFCPPPTTVCTYARTWEYMSPWVREDGNITWRSADSTLQQPASHASLFITCTSVIGRQKSEIHLSSLGEKPKIQKLGAGNVAADWMVTHRHIHGVVASYMGDWGKCPRDFQQFYFFSSQRLCAVAFLKF